jgi:hypothetical protein
VIASGPAPGALRRLRRALDVQRAYVAGIRRLTAEYAKAMVATARDSGDPLPAAPTPAIVLEGESGATAAARFLVENHLDRPISAPVCVSPFQSERGDPADVTLQFEPAVVTLQPHEQLLVCVGTRIGEQLDDAGGYWGVLGVPDLPGTELVVLVRRRGVPHAGENGSRLAASCAADPTSDGART